MKFKIHHANNANSDLFIILIIKVYDKKDFLLNKNKILVNIDIL